jgi:alpha-galactosidase
MYLNPVVGTDQVAANKPNPGSYNDNTSIDNRPDVAAFSKAIAQSGRPILGASYHLQDIIVEPATIANAFRGGDKIDYTKPGPQEYINSIVDLYAS